MKNFSSLRSNQLNESSVIYSELLKDLDSPLIVKKIDLADDSEDDETEDLNDELSLVDVEETVNICDTIIKSIIECTVSNKSVTHQLLDGTEVLISPEDAKHISYVHDELNENNQEKFRILLHDSKNSYDTALSFCRWYTK